MRGALLALALLALAAGCGGGDQPSASEDSGCENVEAPAPRQPGTLEPPAGRLDPSKRWGLGVETNCGSFTITLDLERAPKTAASLVSLASEGYFDDTIFHRIVPGFVIQGGDPTQSGSGGPGYSTVDVPPANVAYTKGTVAMAKTAVEPPGTAGSQFFVVTADDAGLPPEYAMVGRVAKGIEVVERIGMLGDATEEPTQAVVINRMVLAMGE
jgi:peptidyl-prolyl cis-trans isomerase B (cyclophilin B)